MNIPAQESIKYQVSSIKGKSKKTAFGFSLIELMVTISIIAVLAAVGLVVYSSTQKTGRVSKRVQDLAAMRTALELFKTSTGFYPDSTTTTTFMRIDSLSGAGNTLNPSYMPVVPRDPLQGAVGGANCYHYLSNNDTVTSPTPGSTEYKLKTNITATEMSSSDFAQQPGIIDPDRDGIADDSCAIQTTNITAWAYYTSGACNY